MQNNLIRFEFEVKRGQNFSAKPGKRNVKTLFIHSWIADPAGLPMWDYYPANPLLQSPARNVLQ